MRSPRFVSLLAVTVLALSACGGSGEPGRPGGSGRTPQSAVPSAVTTPGQDSRPALATVVTPRVSRMQAKLELVGLNRLGSGHVVVQLRITNVGSDNFQLGSQLADETMSTPEWHWPSGIGLLDPVARKVLMPYRTARAGCLCSTDQGAEATYWFLRPGLSRTVFAVLPAPSGGARTTTVVTPMGPPMVGVSISDAPPTAPPGQTIPNPDSTPITPLIYPIDASAEAVDKTVESQDDGKDVHVNLSSDVLFALGKADLSTQATAILQQTAQQIDASPGSTVQVDGHADSSGTDSINDPLSQQRADAVKARLAALVTRSGVSFNAKGYGSHRPLYPNDSDEGRRRNRRVTVTFAQPVTTAPATPAPSTPTPTASDVPADGQGQKAQIRTAKGTAFTAALPEVRSIGGGLGVLTYTITNEGTERDKVDLASGEAWMELRYIAASTVALVDPAAKKRYPAARALLSDAGSRSRMCICQGSAGVRLGVLDFDPNETKQLWALVALPTTSPVSVDIGTFPRLSGVVVR